jgi:hypothetical protein
MGWKTYKSWFDLWQEQEIFLYPKVFQPALGLIQSSVLCILWYYFTGKLQQDQEDDHSLHSNAEVKNVSKQCLCSAMCLNGMVRNYAKAPVYIYVVKWLYSIVNLRFSAPEKFYVRDRFLLLPGSTKDGFLLSCQYCICIFMS